MLTVASGADTITVRADDVGGDLAVVTTPDGSRAAPVADVDGDDLVVRTTELHDEGDDDGFSGDDDGREGAKTGRSTWSSGCRATSAGTSSWPADPSG